jgi:uncharacterized SAM-binding protein YcdF (DUF218 family)
LHYKRSDDRAARVASTLTDAGPTKAADGRVLAVIFGAAVRADGTASPTLSRRVGYAAAAAEADPQVDLFLSGGVGKYPPSEAKVMEALLTGNVSAQRLILDESSGDTLQTVRAAARYARLHRYATILSCTDPYHQPRVRMLFWLMGIETLSVPLPPRGPFQMRLKMWLRELASIPYDFMAGSAAAWQDRR